jgi:hypothetical protein
MLSCPLCKTDLAEPVPRCPRCQTDLSLLSDFVSDLQTLLDKADAQRKAGELAAAVESYLAVLEVDPANATARTALGPVLRLVRAAGGQVRSGRGGMILVLSLVLAAAAFAAGWLTGERRQAARPSGGPAVPSHNSILAIAPYLWTGLWVFDDPAVGLTKEPFVAGMPEIIDAAVKDIPNAEHGFVLLFSAGPFPGAAVELQWVREDGGGNWYREVKSGREGWLCPALFKYFDNAPPKLYAQPKPKP